MANEFNLSEKIWNDGAMDLIDIKDIIEFIERLKKELHNEIPCLREGWSVAIDKIIDKLAGNKLITITNTKEVSEII